jgi:DNA-binding transcriptional MerR regulator
MILGAPPDKDLLTIGEIGRLTGVPPHTLRYWEKAIGLVRPARRGSGHRRYTKKDLELLAKVRGLVEERGFTLAGVKRHLRQEAKRGPVQIPGRSVVVAHSLGVREVVGSSPTAPMPRTGLGCL